jgi:endonuclease YncB( thermonuclease family)
MPVSTRQWKQFRFTRPAITEPMCIYMLDDMAGSNTCDDNIPLSQIPILCLAGHKFKQARVAKIYDGDTVTLVLPVGVGGAQARVKTRLIGVDACEIRGHDREHGRLARRDLVDALRITPDNADRYNEDFFDRVRSFVDVECFGNDKYGRELVEIAPCGCPVINQVLCKTSPYYASYGGSGPRYRAPDDTS